MILYKHKDHTHTLSIRGLILVVYGGSSTVTRELVLTVLGILVDIFVLLTLASIGIPLAVGEENCLLVDVEPENVVV
jgi:hypothetical protein